MAIHTLLRSIHLRLPPPLTLLHLRLHLQPFPFPSPPRAPLPAVFRLLHNRRSWGQRPDLSATPRGLPP